MVQGNLLEICYKVVNLLDGPAGRLVLAGDVRALGQDVRRLAGVACGLAVVIAISYWKEITGTPGISFLWAMPVGLVAEVGVGALVSLIPIGQKRLPSLDASSRTSRVAIRWKWHSLAACSRTGDNTGLPSLPRGNGP